MSCVQRSTHGSCPALQRSGLWIKEGPSGYPPMASEARRFNQMDKGGFFPLDKPPKAQPYGSSRRSRDTNAYRTA
jgi:hypothetical protein